ncbi:MAG TPA: hypothetical protein VGL40_03685 [Bacillota bacterium]|jgi:hypothetical protein
MSLLTVDAPGGGPAMVEGVGSDLRILTGKFDFDNSYPTGGEAMDLSKYFSQVLGVTFETKAGYIFEYDYAARKVKAYRFDYPGVAAGPAVEVPNLTDLSALVGVRFIAWGRR